MEGVLGNAVEIAQQIMHIFQPDSKKKKQIQSCSKEVNVVVTLRRLKSIFCLVLVA